MDLVRLEDAVERRIVFAMGVVAVAEVGGVVIPGREIESRCATVWSTRIQIHRGTCSANCGTLLVGLTEILPGVRVILQLSFFLHNSNFFRQPSSLRVQRREQLERKTVFFVCEEPDFEGNFAAAENSWKSASSANPDLPKRGKELGRDPST